MLSDLYFQVFGCLLSLGNNCGVTPIQWDPIRRNLHVSRNPYLIRKCYGVFSVYIFNGLFCLFQIWQYRHPEHIRDLSYLLIFLSLQILVFISLSLPSLWPDDVTGAVNSLINYLTNYSGTHKLVVINKIIS